MTSLQRTSGEGGGVIFSYPGGLQVQEHLDFCGTPNFATQSLNKQTLVVRPWHHFARIHLTSALREAAP
jgi:hypothetical protein